jgi:2-epi-5-epi-valiolone epimerase
MTTKPELAGPPSTGVPGARCVDHVALTVPDLDAAVDFVVNALGGALVYRLPPLAWDDDWMERHLDVHPRAVTEIALLRVGPTTNLELFEYRAPDHNAVPPRPCDPGSTHLGLLVDDVDIAMKTLSDRDGLRALGPVRTAPAGSPIAGTRWVRLMAPWGMSIELRSVPASPPYEQTTAARRFGPYRETARPTDDVSVAAALQGFRNVDHLAYTVADIDQATEFFTDVLGAELLYRTRADLTDSALAQALGVPAEGSLEQVALRMGPVDNVELSCFRGSAAGGRPPRNSDVGGRHLALHVDDVDTAAAYLGAQPGCTVLGAPETITEGPIAGDRWVYVRTRVGLHIELVNMPDGSLPYERETTARRRPAGSLRWSDR